MKMSDLRERRRRNWVAGLHRNCLVRAVSMNDGFLLKKLFDDPSKFLGYIAISLKEFVYRIKTMNDQGII
jgi:hypothetical protein